MIRHYSTREDENKYELHRVGTGHQLVLFHRCLQAICSHTSVRFMHVSIGETRLVDVHACPAQRCSHVFITHRIRLPRAWVPRKKVGTPLFGHKWLLYTTKVSTIPIVQKLHPTPILWHVFAGNVGSSHLPGPPLVGHILCTKIVKW